MARSGWRIGVRRAIWIATVVATFALAASCGRRSAPARYQLVVSKARTVATLPKAAELRPCGRLSWLDGKTLLMRYSILIEQPTPPSAPPPPPRLPTPGHAPSTSPPAPHDYRLEGIAEVDLETGKASIILEPQPVGGSPRVAYTWSERAEGGRDASVCLPPMRIGSGGAMSYGSPLASPATGRIAYSASLEGPKVAYGATTPDSGLWIARADGSEAVRVAPPRAWPLVWLRDGQTLLFERRGAGGRSELWSCRADGRRARRVVAGSFWYAVSSDSRRLAFCREANDQRRLYVSDLRGGPARLIARDAWSPTWMGDSLLFVAENWATRTFLPWPRTSLPLGAGRSVYALDPDTGRRTTIVRAGKKEAFWAVHAPPAGESGVFLLVGGGHGEMLVAWICARDDGGLQRVEMKPFPAWAVWSPDGRRLAYIEGGAIKVVDVALKRVKRR